jgi:hypothetical protein
VTSLNLSWNWTAIFLVNEAWQYGWVAWLCLVVEDYLSLTIYLQMSFVYITLIFLQLKFRCSSLTRRITCRPDHDLWTAGLGSLALWILKTVLKNCLFQRCSILVSCCCIIITRRYWHKRWRWLRGTWTSPRFIYVFVSSWQLGNSFLNAAFSIDPRRCHCYVGSVWRRRLVRIAY